MWKCSEMFYLSPSSLPISLYCLRPDRILLYEQVVLLPTFPRWPFHVSNFGIFGSRYAKVGSRLVYAQGFRVSDLRLLMKAETWK